MQHKYVILSRHCFYLSLILTKLTIHLALDHFNTRRFKLWESKVQTNKRKLLRKLKGFVQEMTQQCFYGVVLFKKSLKNAIMD